MSKAHSLLITITFVLITFQLDTVDGGNGSHSTLLEVKELNIFDYRKMYNLRFNPSNIIKNSSEDTLEEIQVEAASEPETNIMKPNNKTLLYNVNLIGNRLKNILFGNGRTVLNAPPNHNTKQGKGLLNLFDIIQFENTICTVTTDINEFTGICYSAAECDSYGGVAVDVCAQGVGVCCVCEWVFSESYYLLVTSIHFQSKLPAEVSLIRWCLTSKA